MGPGHSCLSAGLIVCSRSVFLSCFFKNKMFFERG